MKKLLSIIILAAFALCSAVAFADLQFANNGINIGITTKANVKGCNTTRTGEIVLIDCTAVGGPVTFTGNVTITGNETVTGTSLNQGTNQFQGGIGGTNWQSIAGFSPGINWYAVPQSNTSGINWVGADITHSGINWSDLRTSFGNTSTSVNWQAFGV